MKSYVSRSMILTAAVLFALVTTSCASASPETNSQIDPPAATAPDDNANANAEQPAADFTVEELDGALVGSFPPEVPLYDGQIVDSSSSLSEVNGKPQWSVMMTTGDSLETVDAAIRAAFSTNGWAIASEMESGSGYLLIAHGDGPITTVTYNDMFGPMMITYGVGG